MQTDRENTLGISREAIERFVQNFNEEEKELRAKAKTKEELTEIIEARVKSVTAHHEHYNITPESEMVIGGRSPSYLTGTQTYLEIELEREENPQIIKFYGNAPIEGNGFDCVYKFYIVKGQEVEISSYPHPRIEDEHILTERKEFLKEEKAFKIEKLKRDEIVRTDISDIFI